MNESNVLRNPNYLLLLQGQTVSRIGSILFRIVMSWYIFELTGSGLAMTMYVILESIPRSFIKLISGVMVDKMNKKIVICSTDFINGVNMVFVLVTIIYIQNITFQVSILYIMAAIKGITDAFFAPAVNSIIPNIVSENQIHQAFAFNQSSYQISGILGLTAGLPLVMFFGIKIVVLLNSISFIISAISELFIKYSFIPSSKLNLNELHNEIKNTKRDFKSLLNNIKIDKDLKAILILGIIIPIATQPLINPTQIYILKTYLNSNIDAYMIISTIAAIGALISSLIIGFMKNLNNTKLILILSQVCILALVLIYTVINLKILRNSFMENNSLYILASIIGCISFFSPIIGVGTTSLLIKSTDKTKLGGIIGVQGCILDIFINLTLFMSGLCIDVGFIKIVLLFMLIMNIICLVYIVKKLDV